MNMHTVDARVRMAIQAGVKRITNVQDPQGSSRTPIEACYVMAINPGDEPAARAMAEFLPAEQYRFGRDRLIEGEIGTVRYRGVRLVLDARQEPGCPTLYGQDERVFRLGPPR